MSRAPNKLDALVLADGLVLDGYRVTRSFSAEARFGLHARLRRGAVSVAADLVEDSARRSMRDCLHFVGIAFGSASEVRCLIRVAGRLGFVDDRVVSELTRGYDRVVRALQALATALSGRRPEARGPRP
jgi:four helix bundle protein